MTPKHLITAYYTILRAELTRTLRIWPQTFIPSLITTILYFIIFGEVLGNRIKQINGVDYINFIIPGLVIMSVITNSYANSSSSFFGAKFQRSIESLIISPTPNYIIILGYITASVLRGVLNGTFVLLISLFFTKISIFNIYMIIFFMIISSLIFSMIGLINAIFAKSFDGISWIPSFILTPLSYLGGTFYSFNMLPSFWKKIFLLNPISYLIGATRYSFIGISYFSIWQSILTSILLSIMLFFIVVWLLNNKFEDQL